MNSENGETIISRKINQGIEEVFPPGNGLFLSLLLFTSLSLYITFFLSFKSSKSINIKICASEGNRQKRKGQNPGGDDSICLKYVSRGFGKADRTSILVVYIFHSQKLPKVK